MLVKQLMKLISANRITRKRLELELRETCIKSRDAHIRSGVEMQTKRLSFGSIDEQSQYFR